MLASDKINIKTLARQRRQSPTRHFWVTERKKAIILNLLAIKSSHVGWESTVMILTNTWSSVRNSVNNSMGTRHRLCCNIQHQHTSQHTMNATSVDMSQRYSILWWFSLRTLTICWLTQQNQWATKSLHQINMIYNRIELVCYNYQQQDQVL